MGADHPRNTTLGSGRWLRVKNASGEDMPPFAVCWIDGFTTTDSGAFILQAKKPDSDDHAYYIVQPGGIEDGGVGFVTGDWPTHAAYDASAAAPSVDDEIGPANGNWRLTAGGTGFLCLSDGDDGLVFVHGTSAITPDFLKLVKPSTGQSLSGSSPGTGCTADVYEGTPGSETDTTDDITIYGGRQLESGQTVDDTDWLIVGRVNDQWQLLGPRGGGSSSWTARFSHATLTGDMTTSESAKVMTIVRTWDGTPVTGNVTAYNVPDPNGPDAYLFEGMSGDIGMLSYDPENNKWWMVWIECGAAGASTASMAVKGKPPQPSVAAMNSEAVFDLT